MKEKGDKTAQSAALVPPKLIMDKGVHYAGGSLDRELEGALIGQVLYVEAPERVIKKRGSRCRYIINKKTL